MAKITHKGSWIQIKSLNKEDKKNYLTSISFFFIGALFWGVHLTTVDGIFGPALETDNGHEPFWPTPPLFCVLYSASGVLLM